MLSLTRAAARGNSDLRALLSSSSHDVNAAVNEKGDRLVHFAARARSLSAMRCLVLEFGAQVNVANNFGRRPLHEAIDREPCVKFLLEQGADPNGFKHGTWTPAMIATSKNLHGILCLLVSHGALLSPTNKDGWTALHIAAQQCAVECLQFLLEYASELSIAKSRSGRTPVHMAAASGCAEGLGLLLEAGQNQCGETARVTELKDAEGATILHAACISGSLPCIRLCIKYRCDLRATSKGGMRAVHFAALAGRLDALKLLHAAFVDEEHASAAKEDAPQRGVNDHALVNVTEEFVRKDDMDGFTPAHYAAREGHENVISWLFTAPPNGLGLNASVEDIKGRKPIDIGVVFNTARKGYCASYSHSSSTSARNWNREKITKMLM